MRLEKDPKYNIYKGENGKYYRCLTEVTLDFDGHEIADRKNIWEEVNYSQAVYEEEHRYDSFARYILDEMQRIQREEPEKWAMIEEGAKKHKTDKKK